MDLCSPRLGQSPFPYMSFFPTPIHLAFSYISVSKMELPAFKGSYNFSPICFFSLSPAYLPQTLSPYRATPCYPKLAKELPSLMKLSQSQTPPPEIAIHSSWHIFNAVFLFISPSGCDRSPLVWNSTFLIILLCITIPWIFLILIVY